MTHGKMVGVPTQFNDLMTEAETTCARSACSWPNSPTFVTTIVYAQCPKSKLGIIYSYIYIGIMA